MSSFKRQSATEQIAAAAAEAAQIVSDAQEKATALNDSLIAVRAEYDAKTAYVRKQMKSPIYLPCTPPRLKLQRKVYFTKRSL